MTTKEDIDQTLIQGERVTLECKRAKSSVPSKYVGHLFRFLQHLWR